MLWKSLLRMECVIWKSGLLHDQIHKLVNVNWRYSTAVMICDTGMSKAGYVNAVLSGIDEALHDTTDIIVQWVMQHMARIVEHW